MYNELLSAWKKVAEPAKAQILDMQRSTLAMLMSYKKEEPKAPIREMVVASEADYAAFLGASMKLLASGTDLAELGKKDPRLKVSDKNAEKAENSGKEVEQTVDSETAGGQEASGQVVGEGVRDRDASEGVSDEAMVAQKNATGDSAGQ